jgi:hypothetical protein
MQPGAGAVRAPRADHPQPGTGGYAFAAVLFDLDGVLIVLPFPLAP